MRYYYPKRWIPFCCCWSPPPTGAWTGRRLLCSTSRTRQACFITTSTTTTTKRTTTSSSTNYSNHHLWVRPPPSLLTTAHTHRQYSTTTTKRLASRRPHNNNEADNDKDDDALFHIPPESIPRAPGELDEIKENQQMEANVRNWLEHIVVGLNLCPFAERPLRDKGDPPKLRIYTVRGNDEATILSSLLVVLLRTQDTPGTTSLVICPECYPDDFGEYLQVLHMIQDGLLPQHDLDGILQVAPFHPEFQFEGSTVDSVDNWTNRCPYPMFHVLREDEVERAAAALDGDASRVWRRNIQLLEALQEALGLDRVQCLFTNPQEALTTDERTKVDEILQQHKLILKPKEK